MNTTRIIRIASLCMLIWTIATIAEAQRGGFRPPSIPVPQPYRPPTYHPPIPVVPQPGTPRFGVPQYRPPVQPQAPVVVKRCLNCGHEVPVTSCDGQTCPYCGVVWGSGPGNTISTQETNRTNFGDLSGASGQIPKAWSLVIAAVAAIGLAGSGVLIWYHCRPTPKILKSASMGASSTAFHGPAAIRPVGTTRGAADGTPDWPKDLLSRSD